MGSGPHQSGAVRGLFALSVFCDANVETIEKTVSTFKTMSRAAEAPLARCVTTDTDADNTGDPPGSRSRTKGINVSSADAAAVCRF